MNKRKIFALALSICMIAILAAGGSLAYLFDSDAEPNVFTTGDVYIDLVEEFDPENAKLLPGIDVEKIVNVKNTGSEEAYVRVHVAIPQILDSGSPEFMAFKNTLHWNMSKASMADGLWNWHATNVNGNTHAGYPENGGDWNFYTAQIDGVWYNVYVATYETALASGVTTAEPAIHKVYLDTKVTNQDLIDILDVLEEIKIYVCAEGGQKAGFDDAYTALNEQFGVPGEYTVDWAAVTAGPEDARITENN